MPSSFLRILPRFVCCLVFSAWLFPGALTAAELLERRISVDFRHTPLKNAMEEVARQGQFQWSYNAAILPEGKKVTLRADNWTVREILFAMLGEDYEFKPSGNYLILKKRRRPSDELSGYITDPRTGQRLANASVYDRRTLRSTTTDDNGYYRLKKTGREAELVVAKLGYRDTVLQISSSSPRFQKIQLDTFSTRTAAQDPSFLDAAYTDIERFFAKTVDRWNELNVRDSLTRQFQVSFLPFAGTNHRLSGRVRNDFSLNILAGHSRAVNRLEIGGLANFTRESVNGVQIGGLFNWLRGDNRGLQIAGLFNTTRDTSSGLQVAGLFNAARHSSGVSGQVAGLNNFAGEGTCSIQVAGLFNQADTVEGVQIAGLANHAKKVRGVQIGLFNSADSLSGLQIGLLNRSGRRWLPVVNW